MPALTLLTLVFFFSYGPLEAALPVYSGQTLHANAGGYGLLWTGFGIGAFAGVLTLTRLSHRWRPGIALPMIAVLWGALLCPLFFIRQLPLAMLFLGVAGASWAPYTPMETTLLQRLVPAEIRGQVFGARHSLVVAATPLGAAFGGRAAAISFGAAGDRYLRPRLHPRRAGWPRLTVTASVATPLLSRVGYWNRWVGEWSALSS